MSILIYFLIRHARLFSLHLLLHLLVLVFGHSFTELLDDYLYIHTGEADKSFRASSYWINETSTMVAHPLVYTTYFCEKKH